MAAKGERVKTKEGLHDPVVWAAIGAAIFFGIEAGN
jgi:hypothetical protein